MITDAKEDCRIAREAIKRYDLSDQARATMINLSENATFLVEDPATGRDAVLRVHRAQYHEKHAIESELDWLAAIGRDTSVRTSAALPTRDGERVVAVQTPECERYVVLFERMPGVHPDEELLHPTSFSTLGAITARLHQHSRGWTQPEGFSRFSWDWEHTLGDSPRWGRWQDGFGIDAEVEATLQQAVDIVRRRLEEYGTGPERFGLVHADLRLANLMLSDEAGTEGETTVIDFDDCGFSWFLYDFGTAVSFMEHDPRLPQWQDAWVEGYRSVAELSDDDLAMLPTFVMLRRLLLVAWLGTHRHAKESQELGPGYTATTVPLAERYIASDGASLH